MSNQEQFGTHKPDFNNQSRYAKSVVKCCLPNFVIGDVTSKDKRKYASLVKAGTSFSKEDNSKSEWEVRNLEAECGFKCIELTGCFNWLSCMHYKKCMPSQSFVASWISQGGHISRLPYIFYTTLDAILLVLWSIPKMLTNLLLPRCLKEFQNSKVSSQHMLSFADCGHANKWQMQIHGMWHSRVPRRSNWPYFLGSQSNPTANCGIQEQLHSAAIMQMFHIKRVISHLFHGEKDVDPTMPICVDNLAAIIMNTSDVPTCCMKHVESWCWFGKQAVMQFEKVDGALQQPANVGTKNFQAQDSAHHLILFKAPYYMQSKRCHCN